MRVRSPLSLTASPPSPVARRPGPEVLAARVQSAIASGEVVALLAGDPPVGVALVTFRASVWTGARTATLEDLYVLPGQRGRGYGRSLLRHALAVARQHGAATLELCTGESDAPARALYEAHSLTNREPGETVRLLFYYRRL